MTTRHVVEGSTPIRIDTHWRLELPPGAAPAEGFPLAVALHGYGDDGREFSERLPALAAAPFARLYPDAPHPVSVGEGQRRRIGRSWYAYDGNAATFHVALKHAAAHLDAVVDAVCAANPLDAGRMALIGYSQGGYLGGYLGLTRPDRYRALVAIACRLKVELLDDVLPRLAGHPVLVVHGVRDRAVALDPQREAVRRLEEAGVDVSLFVHERGHGLSPELGEPIRSFLEERLGT